jgi:hypothetical protein
MIDDWSRERETPLEADKDQAVGTFQLERADGDRFRSMSCCCS